MEKIPHGYSTSTWPPLDDVQNARRVRRCHKGRAALLPTPMPWQVYYPEKLQGTSADKEQ